MGTDVIVVGGGLGGLAAATLLARQGKSVRLFEKASHVGGRATSQHQGGAWLNQGPHALYRAGAAERVLATLGVKYSGCVPQASNSWIVRAGELHRLPTGASALLSTTALTASEKWEAAKVLSWLMVGRNDALADETWRQYVDRTIRDQGTRAFILMLSRVTSYTNAPDVVSASALFAQMRQALRSNVLYLDGGWQTLVEGLRAAAENAGVQIQLGAGVDRIESDATGVHLSDGSAREAPVVIIATGPRVAAALMPGGQLGTLATRCVSSHAACLDVALDGLPRAGHTLALGIDTPLYFSVHTKSARLADPGVEVIHVAKYLEPGDSGLAARGELENLLDLMQPGWRTRVREQRYLPHMTVMNDIPQAAHGGFPGRAPVAVRDVPGLFLVGDWVGPEGFLADAVLSSAERAAREIMVGAEPKRWKRRLAVA